MLCSNCGKKVEDSTVICPNCYNPVELPYNNNVKKELENNTNKNWYKKISDFIFMGVKKDPLHRMVLTKVSTLMLLMFLGYLGVHRFYLGYKKVGFTMLILWGMCKILKSNIIYSLPSASIEWFKILGTACEMVLTIWVFIDLIRIFIGKLLPKESSICQKLLDEHFSKT